MLIQAGICPPRGRSSVSQVEKGSEQITPVLEGSVQRHLTCRRAEQVGDNVLGISRPSIQTS